jgi:hypothetical protein
MHVLDGGTGKAPWHGNWKCGCFLSATNSANDPPYRFPVSEAVAAVTSSSSVSPPEDYIFIAGSMSAGIIRRKVLVAFGENSWKDTVFSTIKPFNIALEELVRDGYVITVSSTGYCCGHRYFPTNVSLANLCGPLSQRPKQHETMVEFWCALLCLILIDSLVGFPRTASS